MIDAKQLVKKLEGYERDDYKDACDTCANHAGDDYCEYCICNYGCPRGVTGGPNGPIYSPCADRDISVMLDLDALLEDLKHVE